MRFVRTRLAVLIVSALFIAIGCDDDDEMQDFSLRFAAVDGTTEVGCGNVLTGFGSGATPVEISDLRFYVSNVRFYNASGRRLDVELDKNEFQYVGSDGSVVLIDLTGTATGACSGNTITYPEGTARTNNVLTGRVASRDVSRVTFDIGMPQWLMKSVITNHTAEDAPSPLAEMHWSWAFAYRHFVMNFVIDDNGTHGEGYVHVGSNDCGGDGSKALTDQDVCGKVNAPAVDLEPFDLKTNTIVVDVRAVLAGLDLLVDNEGTMVPGCACHSSAAQPDCATIFANFGVDQATGTASPDLNTVFSIR